MLAPSPRRFSIVTPLFCSFATKTSNSLTLKLTITPDALGDWTANVLAGADDGSTLTLLLHSKIYDGPNVPVITSGPNSALLRAKGSYELTVTVKGTEPHSYQWYHNHKICPGCTDKSMVLNPVTLADAGTYEVKVANEAGAIFSDPAEVSVYEVDAAVAINAIEDDKIEMIAPVSGAGITTPAIPKLDPQIKVIWQLNGKTLSDDATYSGTSTAKLTIKKASSLTAGRYSVVVNPKSQNVAAKTWVVSVLMRPTVLGDTAPLVAMSVAKGVTFHFTSTPAATKFLFKGLPPGVVANAKTGTLSGMPTRPGSYKLSLAAVNRAGTGSWRDVAVIVQAIDQRSVGSFQGIIGRDPGNDGLGGRVTLTTTAIGQCTGSVVMGKRTARFSAQMELKPDGTPYQVQFQVATAQITDDYTVTIDPVTGKLGGGVVSNASPFSTAAISGWVNSWSTGTAGAWSEYVTVALAPPANVAANQLMTPFGISIGTATVSPSGVVTWAGRMADGTVTTASSLISRALLSTGKPDHVEVPLSLSLNGGSAQGMLTLIQKDPLQADYHSIGGTLDWFKLPSGGRSYANGIPLHTLSAVGGRYSKPANGQLIINLLPTVSNAQWVYTGVGIEASDSALFLANPFTISAGGQSFFDKPDPLGNVFNVNLTTGLYSGSITLTDASPVVASSQVRRTFTTYGVLLKDKGKGFFLLPGLPNVSTTLANTPIASGRLILQGSTF